jgi:hypothetical protein
MPLTENEFARRYSDRIEVRTAPLRLVWPLNSLTTSDRHSITAAFSLAVAPLASATERRMLEETFLSQKSFATPDDVLHHFSTALESVAARLVATRPAAEWLNNEGARSSLLSALLHRAQSLAFTAGLELLPPHRLDLDSPTLRRQTHEALDRTRSEQRTADQIQHLQRLSTLQREFQSLLQSTPERSPGQLLSHLPPADQSDILLSTLRCAAEADVPSDLYAAAGPHLLRLDPREPSLNPTLLVTPQSLGPLRSVHPASVDSRAVLLLGARDGIILFDSSNPEDAVLYKDPRPHTMGFNRAIIWKTLLCAAHTETGITVWDLALPSTPRATLPLSEFQIPNSHFPSPRNLQILDGSRLVFSIGSQLLVLNQNFIVSQSQTSRPSDIVSITLDSDRIILIHSDGHLAIHETQSLRELSTQLRTGSIAAAASVPWLGRHRFILDTPATALSLIGPDDLLVTTYPHTLGPPKSLVASASFIAALTHDRQRLAIWNIWANPRAPIQFHAGTLTPHRIAGIAFL